MRGRVLLTVGLVGCNQIYGLDPTRLIPDAPSTMEPDLDQDGIADRDDNCVDRANPAQSDVDHDGIGDACDDCPLLANKQGSDFDADGIGDFCDPHATTKDCVLVVDAFVDPDNFAASWTVEGDTNGGKVEHARNSAHLVPATASSIAITTRDAPGMVDVQLLGNAQQSIEFSTSSGYDAVTQPDTCKLQYIAGSSTTLQLDGLNPGSPPSPKSLTPTNPLNHELYVRMQTAVLDAGNPRRRVSCRIDFGIAVGLDQNAFDTVAQGAVRLTARQGAMVINAVMYTRLSNANETCASTVFR